MNRLRKLTALGVTALLVLALTVPGTLAAQVVVPEDMGTIAYSYTEQLAVGARLAGTDAELAAAGTRGGLV